MSTDQLAESLLRRHLNGRNVVVFAKNLGPYHVARFRVLGRRLAGYGAHLVGVELAAAEKAYPWRVSRDALEFQWRTLASDGAVEDISGWGQRRLTRKCLEELQPVVTVVPGWSDAFLRYALAWCRSGPGICLVAGDSTADTRRTDYEPKRRLRLLELYKRWLLRGVDGALVSGDASRDYFASLGVPRERIFLKYDVVDNEYIAQRAEQAQGTLAAVGVELERPGRHALEDASVGRGPRRQRDLQRRRRPHEDIQPPQQPQNEDRRGCVTQAYVEVGNEISQSASSIH